MTDKQQKKKSINEKCVFAVLPIHDSEVPILLVGFPRKALNKMMNDKSTHNFDLTSTGIPIKMMFFSENTHADCMKVLEQAAADAGIPLNDMRNQDFDLKPTHTEH